MMKMLRTLAFVAPILIFLSSATPASAQLFQLPPQSRINWCKWETTATNYISTIEEMEVQAKITATFAGIMGRYVAKLLDEGAGWSTFKWLSEYQALRQRYAWERKVIDCLKKKLQDLLLGRNKKPLPNTKLPPQPTPKVKLRLNAIWQRVIKLEPKLKKVENDLNGVTFERKPGGTIEVKKNGSIQFVILPGTKPLKPLKPVAPDTDFDGDQTAVHLPVGETKPGDFGIDFGSDFKIRWGPKIDFGRNTGNTGPYDSFDNDMGMAVPHLRVWYVLPGAPFGADRARIGGEVYGGTNSGSENLPASNRPGLITLIDGSNPGFGAFNSTSGARLQTDFYKIGGVLHGKADYYLKRAELLITVLAGFVYSMENAHYQYSQTVIAGAAVPAPFTHNLDYRLKSHFVGARLGVYLTRALWQKLSATLFAYVEPGYQAYELSARQWGTALGTAAVNDSVNGFAFRTGFGVKLHYDITKSIRISLNGGTRYNNSVPSTIYPNAGGQPLRATTSDAWIFAGGIRIGFKLSY